MNDFNKFAGPIPGQSLTDEPGNAPWEHPPQFTDPAKAMEWLYGEVSHPRALQKVVALLHAGVPAEVVSQTFLFGGFTEGKWTPDMMVLMAKPTLQMIAALGDGAGVNVKLGTAKRYKNDDFNQLVAKLSKDDPTPEAPIVTPEASFTPPAGGLMSPKGVA